MAAIGPLSMSALTVTHVEPEPCNLSKREIENIADVVAKETGFKPGDQITPVVRKLGGKIEFLDWEGWHQHQSDTVEIRGPRDFVIRLMGVDGPLRHRFTVAHELGHYVLHSLCGRVFPMVAGRSGSNERVEWEANWFAAAFLMPEQRFRAKWKELGEDTLAMAGHFLVSTEAVEVRKKTLSERG